jgi:hypothetical protein
VADAKLRAAFIKSEDKHQISTSICSIIHCYSI